MRPTRGGEQPIILGNTKHHHRPPPNLVYVDGDKIVDAHGKTVHIDRRYYTDIDQFVTNTDVKKYG